MQANHAWLVHADCYMICHIKFDPLIYYDSTLVIQFAKFTDKLHTYNFDNIHTLY